MSSQIRHAVTPGSLSSGPLLPDHCLVATGDTPHIRVSHSLEGVHGKRRACPGAAVDQYLSISLREARLNVSLYDSLADVLCARDVACSPLALLSHINDASWLAELCLYRGHLLDAGLG